MKSSHLSSALRLTLFLMLITSFTTAVAYDFESGGIYYNITSPNTVEVTYRDTDYGSYTGNVEIPRSVSNNNKTYAVTAIGDSAFYFSSIDSVIIPETVRSIGNDAFSYLIGVGDPEGKELISITCLSTTPPVLNGKLGENYLNDGLPLYIYAGVTIWPNIFVLYVPYESLDAYNSSSEWSNSFDFICYIGAGRTDAPTIEMHQYEDGTYVRDAWAYISGLGTIYSCYRILNKNGYVQSWSTWEKDEDYVSYHDINQIDPLSRGYFEVYAFAHEYGKLPSYIVCATSDAIYSYDYYPPFPELLESWEEDISFYDFIVDGICYRYIGNNDVAVTHDSNVHLVWEKWNVYDYGEIVSINDENSVYDATSYSYYNKSIVIPQTVDYNGKTYNVTSIDNYTFTTTNEIGYDYQYFYMDNSSETYASYFVRSATWWVTIGGTSPSSLILPSSLKYIDEHAFNHYNDSYNSSTFIITGDGEWSAGSLDVSVKRFDIASGITAIPGMKINPREVYCYAKVPPTCDENTFTDYTGTLHVPESSLAAYFTAPYWCNFANIVGDAVELQSISINKDSAELLIGEQVNLNVVLQPINASIDSIQWKSSNPSIATVTSDGVVTAKALGECDIIATCLDKQATCHVKVVEQVVTITLDQHHASLLPNHILTLTPTVSPASTPLAVTSSNPAVAAARLVNGVVQVVGISPGTSVIKVSSADDDAFADSCLVNVYTEVGDVDGDGYVKIDDVVALIDYLLSGSASGIDVANADVDFDGAIGISDVPTLIDHLLGGGSSQNERFMVNGVPFTMVRVAAGTFMMGATEEQGDDASTWEKPVHQVTLSSYLIGQTEVTQELWQAVMGTNPSLHGGSLQKPVENVSWDDCQAFIAQLNALTGQNFRMLTEAEWEYAARGGNKSLGYKYAGSNNIDDVGWVTGTTTHPVGELQPNELGLYDMSGNVDEWVWDYFGYYTSEPQTNPTGPETGDNKMYRGGSWYGGAKASRVSYRFFRVPTFKRGTMGLRLAL